MASNITKPWRQGVPVTELTGKDLNQARNETIGLSDRDHKYTRRVQTLANALNLGKSATIDRSVRIELAYAIDAGKVPFSRDDFDVAYIVPPSGWVDDNEDVWQVDLNPVDEEEVDTSSRIIHATVPPVVEKMVDAAVDQGPYDSKTAVMKKSIDRYFDSTTDPQQNPPLAVRELFRTNGRREILSMFLEYPSKWMRKSEITENVDVSRETVRENLDPLRRLGIIEVRDPDVQIPHYRLAESPPIQVLQSMDCSVEALIELFDYRVRQRVVVFFIESADPNETYSKYKIHHETDIGYDSLKNHMNSLANLGLLNTEQGSKSTEYSLAESHIVEALCALNEAVFESYLQNSDEEY